MKTLLAILTFTVAVYVTEARATSPETFAIANDSLTAQTVDVKILQKFRKANPGVIKAMWQSIDEGYTASFKKGDITHTWVYNDKYRIGYEIKTYDKSNVPDHLANRIENAYREYEIESVEEIHILGRVYYYVRTVSNKFRKLIKMDENEIYASEIMKRE